jgi:GST-like protein
VIEFSNANTPGAHAIWILLEELAQVKVIPEYRIVPSEQMRKEIDRSIPIIVDDDVSGEPIVVTGSKYSVIYLAEKFSSFLGSGPYDRARVFEWISWQSNVLRVPPEPVGSPEDIRPLFEAVNQRLSRLKHLGCGTYSIADMWFFPWLERWLPSDQAIKELPELERWRNDLLQRPAVRRGMGMESPARAIQTFPSRTLDIMRRNLSIAGDPVQGYPPR